LYDILGALVRARTPPSYGSTACICLRRPVARFCNSARPSQSGPNRLLRCDPTPHPEKAADSPIRRTPSARQLFPTARMIGRDREVRGQGERWIGPHHVGKAADAAPCRAPCVHSILRLAEIDHHHRQMCCCSAVARVPVRSARLCLCVRHCRDFQCSLVIFDRIRKREHTVTVAARPRHYHPHRYVRRSGWVEATEADEKSSCFRHSQGQRLGQRSSARRCVQ